MRPSNQPAIALLIPTRNRLDTLKATLATALEGQNYDRYTVLVSDNASTDATKDYVLSLSDPRVRYINTGQPCSMAQNYEFALENVEERSGWVMLIGDDDGLVPGAVERAAELIVREQPEAIRSVPCSYAWPSLTGLPWGRLGVPVGSRMRVCDAQRALRRVLSGQQSYHQLPMIYQGGVLPIPLLDRIKRIRGRFFQSCIPDVYSAMAITSSIHSYLLVDEPLAINGLSGHSIGMSQGRDRFHGGSPAHRFRSENNIPFHADVPLRSDGDYPVGQAIVYEPFLQSSYLRSGPPLTSHREQLVLALAEAGPQDRALVIPWAQRFAAMHALDFSAAAHEAAMRAPLVRARRLRAHLANATRVFSVGSSAAPILTVAEAATATARIRAQVKSRLALLPHLLQKVARRFDR